MRGIWLFLCLVIEVLSRKVVAWDVADWKGTAIASDLVSRTCLRVCVSKGMLQPLNLRGDISNAMRAGTLESRLEEPGVLRSV